MLQNTRLNNSTVVNPVKAVLFRGEDSWDFNAAEPKEVMIGVTQAAKILNVREEAINYWMNIKKILPVPDFSNGVPKFKKSEIEELAKKAKVVN